MNRRKFVNHAILAAAGACLVVDSLPAVTKTGARTLQVNAMTKLDMGHDPYGFISKMWPEFVTELREEGITEKSIKEGFSKPESFGDGSFCYTFHPA